MAKADTEPADAEARLFARLYPRLRRFAAVVGPVEVDPDDLLQEAVARLLRSHRLDDIDDPAAYLRRTIVNLASNYRRGFARRRRALARAGREAASSSDSYPSDLADLAILPAHERAVLYLTEVEGYRYREVAGLLGCSEAAARKRAMRGRRRLYAFLAEEVGDG